MALSEAWHIMAGWNLSLHNKKDITYWLLYKFKMKKLIALNNSTNARNYRLECNFGEGLKVVCYHIAKLRNFWSLNDSWKFLTVLWVINGLIK